MKILGRDVVFGTKKICKEYTTKANGTFDDCIVSCKEYKGDNIERNVIFIRDKKGYYIELKDLETFPTLSLICYGAAPRWKTSPNSAGDCYVADIKPYFSAYDQEKLYEIKTLIKSLQNYDLEKHEEVQVK